VSEAEWVGIVALSGILVSFFTRIDALRGVQDFLATGNGLKLLVAQVAIGESIWFWICTGVVAALIQFSEWFTKDIIGQVLGLALGIGVFAAVLFDTLKLWPTRVRTRLCALFIQAVGNDERKNQIVHAEAPHFQATSRGSLNSAMTRVQQKLKLESDAAAVESRRGD